MTGKLFLLALSFLPLFSVADDGRDFAQKNLNQFFAEFEKDPVSAMNRTPVKRHVSGPTSIVRFSEAQIQNKDYVLLKDQARKNICALGNCERQDFSINSGIDQMNNPVGLIGFQDAASVNLFSLDQFGRQATVRVQPWSGSYWPAFMGGMGGRFGDPNFPKSTNYHDHLNFRVSYVFGQSNNPNTLSPAEKYDLLVGDPNFTLTNAIWGKSAWYQQNNGQVEAWMGYCHGWAPASYLERRPRRAIKLSGADGRVIQFNPDDIKALTTLAWAQTGAPQVKVGGRCNVKNPATDNVGRIIDPMCFDTNPGSWHMALVNIMGRQGKSFTLDATFDYEVWNQPAVSYRIYYFNPIDRKLRENLRDATVPRGSFNDVFARYRSPYAQFIAGVTVEIVYGNETYPSLNTQ
ncbi:MAG: hypothetical protein V4736_07180, partial [Bdellovibrionota bacterium]